MNVSPNTLYTKHAVYLKFKSECPVLLPAKSGTNFDRILGYRLFCHKFYLEYSK